MCYSKALSTLENALSKNLLDTVDSVYAMNNQDSTPLPTEVRQELYHRLRCSSDSSPGNEDSWAPDPQDAHENKIDDPIETWEIKAKEEFQKFLVTVRLCIKSQEIPSNIWADTWDNMKEDLKEILENIYQKILEVLTWIKDTLGNAAEAVWNALKRLFRSLQDLFSSS